MMDPNWERPEDALGLGEDEEAWAADQREAFEAALGAGAWEDLCIWRSDPSEPAFWDEVEELDFED